MSTGAHFPANPGPFQSPPAAPAARRSRTLIWLLVASSLALVCVCSGLCLVPAGFGIYQAVSQRDELEEALADCLEDIVEGDSDDSLEHFSSRARKHQLVTAEQIEALRTSPHLEGYQSLEAKNVSLNVAANTDPKKPQGVVAHVSGTVNYKNGPPGQFQATLEKETDNWRIYSLNIKKPATEAPTPEKPLTPEAPAMPN